MPELLDDDLGGEDSNDKFIEIGEEKLNPDQAKELIEAGKQLKTLKEEYPNIDFNELPKSFTQKSQELAEIKKNLEKKQDDKSLTTEEEARLKQIDTFFEDPYVKQKLDARDKTKEQQIKEDFKFKQIKERLESELDGSDGRPKFDYLKVLEYGKENGIFNLEKSYKDLHETELDEWKAKKLLEKKKPGTFSIKRPGLGANAPAPKDAPKTFKEAREASEADLEE